MAAPPKERRRFLLFSSNMALYSAFRYPNLSA
jgi:hypothetical protein